jgi:hypothetical protein
MTSFTPMDVERMVEKLKVFRLEDIGCEKYVTGKNGREMLFIFLLTQLRWVQMVGTGRSHSAAQYTSTSQCCPTERRICSSCNALL